MKKTIKFSLNTRDASKSWVDVHYNNMFFECFSKKENLKILKQMPRFWVCLFLLTDCQNSYIEIDNRLFPAYQLLDEHYKKL